MFGMFPSRGAWRRPGLRLVKYDSETGRLMRGEASATGWCMAWAEGSPSAGRPRLGVSSCLLGEEVRFNGGHKLYRFLTDELAPYVDWVPYCPEMEIGL